jgi:hypothetical protein
MITEIDLASCISALISKQSADLQLPVLESSHVVQGRTENPQRRFHRSNSCTIGTLGWGENSSGSIAREQRVLGIVVRMYWNPIDVEGIKPKLYSVMPEVVSGKRGTEHVIQDAKTRSASRFTFVNLGYLGRSKSQQQHFEFWL